MNGEFTKKQQKFIMVLMTFQFIVGFIGGVALTLITN